MSNNKKNIDDLFKERLGDYTETPPAGAWDAIQHNLGNIPKAAMPTPYLWVKYILVSAIAVGVIYFAAHNLLLTTGAENALVSKNNTINIPDQQNLVAKNNLVNQTNKNTNKVNTDNTNTTKTTKSAIADNNIDNTNTETKAVANNNKNITKQGNIAPTKQNKPKSIFAQNNYRSAISSKPSNIKNGTNNVLVTEKNKTASIKSANPKMGRAKKINPAIAANKTKVANTTALMTSVANMKANTAIGNESELNNTPTIDAPTTNTKPLLGATDVLNASQPEAINTFKTEPEQQNQPKKVDIVVISPLPKKNIPKAVIKTPFNKIEYGIKGGYEISSNNNGAKSLIGAPYIQYNVSNKLSFLVQPGIKSNNIGYKKLQGSQSFYKVNNDGHISLIDSSKNPFIGGGDSIKGYFYIKDYLYTQTHDSIVKSYSIGGNYISFELPVLLKYKLLKHLSIMGGASINYNSLVSINENTYTISGITKTGQATTIAMFTTIAPPAITKVITYQGNPLSTYKAPLYVAPKGTIITYGYMLGFSYGFGERWMMDVVAQQSSAKTNVIGGYNINTALSAFYWRLMLGYRL